MGINPVTGTRAVRGAGVGGWKAASSWQPNGRPKGSIAGIGGEIACIGGEIAGIGDEIACIGGEIACIGDERASPTGDDTCGDPAPMSPVCSLVCALFHGGSTLSAPSMSRFECCGAEGGCGLSHCVSPLSGR